MYNGLGKGVLPMPEQYLDEVISHPPRRNRPGLLQALPLLPQLLSSLFQSIPMPWETEKRVSCTYNSDGIIVDLKSPHSDDTVDYACLWIQYVLECLGITQIRPPSKKKRSTREYHEAMSQLYSLIPTGSFASYTSRSLFPSIYSAARSNGYARTRSGFQSQSRIEPASKHGNPACLPWMDHRRRRAQRDEIKILQELDGVRRSRSKIKPSKGACPVSTEKPPRKKEAATASLKREFRSHTAWTKSARHISALGLNVLNYVLEERKIKCIRISPDFSVHKKKQLTTKEKKKCRLGESFHLIRELLRLLQRLALIFETEQGHERMRKVFHELTHVGVNTGVYRYKYSLVRQISAVSKLARRLEYTGRSTGTRPNKCSVIPIWCEPWRIWTHFLRGFSPELSRRLESYVIRRREGRSRKRKAVTKQREESHADIEMRINLLAEAEAHRGCPVPEREKKAISLEFSRAWKHWKADTTWAPPQSMSPETQQLIRSHVGMRARAWEEAANQGWRKILNGKYLSKTQRKKTQGKMLRILLKHHRSSDRDNFSSRVRDEDGGSDTTGNATGDNNGDSGNAILDSNNVIIPQTNPKLTPYTKSDCLLFPEAGARAGAECVACGMHRKHASTLPRLSIAPQNTPGVPGFQLLQIQQNGTGPAGAPKKIPSEDLLLDAVLLLEKQYVSREGLNKKEKQALSYLENTKKDLSAALASVLSRIFRSLHSACFSVRMHGTEAKYASDIEAMLVDAFLDHVLWYYASECSLFPAHIIPLDAEPLPVTIRAIAQRLHAHLTGVGNSICTGMSLATLNYGKMLAEAGHFQVKRMLLGICDAKITEYITGRMEATVAYKDMTCVHRKGLFEGLEFYPFLVSYYIQAIEAHLLPLSQNISARAPPFTASHNILIPMEHTPDSTAPSRHSNTEHNSNIGHNYNATARQLDDAKPEDTVGEGVRMCGYARCGLLGHVLLSGQDMPSFCLPFLEVSEHVLLDYYPARIHIGGFQVILQPDQVHLCAAPESVSAFRQKSSRILAESTDTNFAGIARKWNKLLMHTVIFHREALTLSFYREITRVEAKIRRKIMQGTNSHMGKRYPPALFYGPCESGGLGMISADVLLQATPSWPEEIERSDRAYAFLASFLSGLPEDQKKRTVITAIKALALSGTDIHSTGIPRVSTYIHKPRGTYMWRSRHYTRRTGKWTDRAEDGVWVTARAYAEKMPQKYSRGLELCTLRPILRAEWTPFPPKSTRKTPRAYSGHSRSVSDTPCLVGHTVSPEAFQKRARASAARRLPNKMLALWWSPVINRTSLNIGHPTEIEGVPFTISGKLASLGISYRNLFQDGLWTQIQREAVGMLRNELEKHILPLGIVAVEQNTDHQPPKSHSLSAIRKNLITHEDSAVYRAALTPSLIIHLKPSTLEETCSSIWILVRLRWGNIDSPSVSAEVQTWMEAVEESSGAISTHGFPGVAFLIDLVQCTYCIRSNHAYAKSVCEIIQSRADHVLASLVSLQILRKRVRTLVGYRETSGKASEVSDPRDLFAQKSGVYVQLESRTLHLLNVFSGEYCRLSPARNSISSICQVLFGALEGKEFGAEEGVQHVYADARLHGLLSKSGMSFAFVPVSFHIPLGTLQVDRLSIYRAWYSCESKVTASEPHHSRAYTLLCRTALVLRYAQIFGADPLGILGLQIGDSAWIEEENRLMQCICMHYVRKAGGTANECMHYVRKGSDNSKESALCFSPDSPGSTAMENVLLERTSAQEALKSLVFESSPEISFVNRKHAATKWLDMTSWRYRYAHQAFPDPREFLGGSSSAVATNCYPVGNKENAVLIGSNVLEVILSISDLLIPVMGLIVSSRSEPCALLVPAQSYSSPVFSVYLEPLQAYTIQGVVCTYTAFSEGIEYVYDGMDLPTDLFEIRISIPTASLETSRCESARQINGFALTRIQVCNLELDPHHTSVLTGIEWNRNMKQTAVRTGFIPDLPAPFYAEEFRMSHFPANKGGGKSLSS